MTALDDFDRLEAVGRLKRTAEDAGVEVVVTFGEATLTMNALNPSGDTPMSHWSIAAVTLQSETEARAIYRLDAQSDETLTIEDQTFRAAMTRVLQNRTTVTHRRPKRKWMTLGLGLAALGLLSAVLLPKLITGTATSMISPERAQILAAEMVPMIHARTGPACETPLSETALNRLAKTLNPDGGAVLKIHDMGDVGTISLPGGQILLSEQVLADAPNNATIAAWGALGIAGMIDSSAISELFAETGTWDALSFLSTGELPETAKTRAINKMFIGADDIDPSVVQNAEALLRNAKLPVAGLDWILGQLPRDDPQISVEIMTDAEWNALGRACSG